MPPTASAAPSTCVYFLSAILAGALLYGSPLRAADSLAALRAEVGAHPAQVGLAVQRAVRSDAAAPHWPARVTVAAIQALGPQATSRQIGVVVYAALKTAPAQVLDIVHAAMLASPNDAAESIATAAVAGVPDPWKKVTYQPESTRLRSYMGSGEGDYKSGEGDYKSGKSYVPPEGRAMPLAQAIVDAIMDARGGLNASSLMAAVDAALVGDPSWLLAAISSSSIISPIGDSGVSNFGNEPVVSAPGAPIPSPVSR